MQRRGPICSCTAGSLQARLIPRWFRPYSVHRVPRWKGVPLSEYIPIKKSELRYTRLCPACTLHPAPCTFHPLASAFLFPFLQPSLFPCLSFLLARFIFTSPPQLTSSHPTPFTSAFCLPPTEPRIPFRHCCAVSHPGFPHFLPSLSTSFSTAITPPLFS